MDVLQKLTGLFNGAFLYYDIIEPQCLIFVCGMKAGVEDKWSPGGSDGKESARNEGDMGSIPGLGGSPRGGHGNPL